MKGTCFNLDLLVCWEIMRWKVLLIIMELWNHLTNINESSINNSGITRNNKVMLFCFSFVHYILKQSCI